MRGEAIGEAHSSRMRRLFRRVVHMNSNVNKRYFPCTLLPTTITHIARSIITTLRCEGIMFWILLNILFL